MPPAQRNKYHFRRESKGEFGALLSTGTVCCGEDLRWESSWWRGHHTHPVVPRRGVRERFATVCVPLDAGKPEQSWREMKMFLQKGFDFAAPLSLRERGEGHTRRARAHPHVSCPTATGVKYLARAESRKRERVGVFVVARFCCHNFSVQATGEGSRRRRRRRL